MDSFVQCSINTNFGAIFLVGNSKGIASIWFDQLIGDYPPDTSGVLKPWINQLSNYFTKGIHPQIPTILPEVTAFQKSVWQAAQNIPLGAIITYKELAHKIRKPNAARAVGNALGANPIPIVIPCHRIVGKDSLGGFTAGLGWKQFLLEHEKKYIR